jgi:hypothetical protein
MPFAQTVKSWLVKRGPRFPLTRLAVGIHAKRQGFEVLFTPDWIEIAKSGRVIRLNNKGLHFVPIMMAQFDLYHETIEAVRDGELNVLDFPGPAGIAISARASRSAIPASPKRTPWTRTPIASTPSRA